MEGEGGEEGGLKCDTQEMLHVENTFSVVAEDR